jgi:hypothetical protein
MSTKAKTIKLSNLKNLAIEISQVQCDFYAEACSVALQKNHHKNPTLTVNGDFNGSFVILRHEVTKLAGWEDNIEVAENGAIAIAFFLINEYSEYSVIRQSIRGTGFDYWLGYKPDHKKFDPNNFFVARLEISGILQGNDSEIKRRVTIKLKQVDKSAKLKLPAYISVTEFSNCKSHLVSK